MLLDSMIYDSLTFILGECLSLANCGCSIIVFNQPIDNRLLLFRESRDSILKSFLFFCRYLNQNNSPPISKLDEYIQF